MEDVLSNEQLEPLIFAIRGHRVVLDADLARIYAVSTKAFNQALKRNQRRFPADFAFQLTVAEFAEHGALMATNILRSERAVQMSVFVVRAFVRLREEVAANTAVLARLAEIDRKLLQHDVALLDIYQKLLPLLQPPPDPPARRIGFHTDDD